MDEREALKKWTAELRAMPLCPTTRPLSDERCAFIAGYRAALAASAPNPSAKQDCKCRRLGDWNGSHHPLCDANWDAAPLAQSAEQDRIDAERWRMAVLYEYVTEFEVLGIDQRIAIDKGTSK
jgi:hypothetical protein